MPKVVLFNNSRFRLLRRTNTTNNEVWHSPTCFLRPTIRQFFSAGIGQTRATKTSGEHIWPSANPRYRRRWDTSPSKVM